MTAAFLFALLIAGALNYIRWAMHGIAHGASAWWFVAGAPVAYLAPVVVLVAASFVLTWIWRTPRSRDTQLDWTGSARLFAGEVFAVALSWPSMALHRLLIRDPAPAAATLPVILVHGVLVNDGAWLLMRRRLMRRGVGPIYTINYGPPYSDIEHFAEQLDKKIESVRASTGAADVALVCHSMGGLVARAYLRRKAGAPVRRVVTIGTPHHGSVLAWVFIGRCLAQMRPGNPWLRELNRDEGEPAPLPVTSIWSRHDSLVAPQVSCELENATNVALPGVGHNALLGDERVTALVVRELAVASEPRLDRATAVAPTR